MKAPEKPQHLPTFYTANLPEGALADDAPKWPTQFYFESNLVPREPIESQFGEDRWYPINPPQTQAELAAAMEQAKEDWAGHRERSDAAINYEQSVARVYDRFRDTVDTTWERLTDLRGEYRLLIKAIGLVHMAQDEGAGSKDILGSMPEPYASARQNFEDKFGALLALRDDPTTPFMVARMIDVDTSVYGSDDDTAHIIYEKGNYYDEDEGGRIFIKNPAVLDEMRRNDDWMNNPYSFDVDTKAESLRRKDELVMGRIHHRVDLVDDPTEYLLKYGGMYHYINDAFGLDVTTLPEPAKLQLIDYLTTVSGVDIKRISAVANKLQPEVRTQFAEVFLATEFGDDLGEQILTLAEHGGDDERTPDQLGRVLDILRSVSSFTTEGILHEVDPSLADDIRRGVSTRTSEVLYALNQRLEKGKPTEKIELSLAKLAEWAGGIAEMLQHGVPQRVQKAGDTKLYHFINPKTGQKYPGAVELTTNGKFAEEATARERYIKEGRGARGSFTYDEEQPHLALSLNGMVRRGAMNGRFDKSVYNIVTDESEPDAEHAEVSFDLASIHGAKNSKSRMTAEAITEGSAIRDTGHGNKGGAKNFTYDIIDQSWGQRDKFAGAIREFGDILDGREREHRGKKLAGQAVKYTHTILESA